MKCYECNIPMQVTTENYAYQASDDLPHVTLQNIKVGRCPRCGEESVAIPKMEQLHQAIAESLAKKKTKLLPPEIRFLRKHLGWSGADLARQFSVTVETVSRWENGRSPMSPTAEKLLRMCTLYLDPIDDYSNPSLQEFGIQDTQSPRIRFAIVDNQWQPEELTATP